MHTRVFKLPLPAWNRLNEKKSSEWTNRCATSDYCNSPSTFRNVHLWQHIKKGWTEKWDLSLGDIDAVSLQRLQHHPLLLWCFIKSENSFRRTSISPVRTLKHAPCLSTNKKIWTAKTSQKVTMGRPLALRSEHPYLTVFWRKKTESLISK